MRKVNKVVFLVMLFSKAFDESEGVLAGKKLLTTIKSYGGPADKGQAFANKPLNSLNDFSPNIGIEPTLNSLKLKGFRAISWGNKKIQLGPSKLVCITKGRSTGSGAALVG